MSMSSERIAHSHAHTHTHTCALGNVNVSVFVSTMKQQTKQTYERYKTHTLRIKICFQMSSRCEVKRSQPNQTEPNWSEIGFLCSGTKRLISELKCRRSKQQQECLIWFFVCVCICKMWMGPVVKQVCMRGNWRRPECFSNNYRMWHSSWTTRSLTRSITLSR